MRALRTLRATMLAIAADALPIETLFDVIQEEGTSS